MPVNPRDEAPSQILAVDVVEDESGLAALAEEWNDLFGKCHRPSLCASHAWACAWWQTFGGRSDGAGKDTYPYILLFRDDAGSLLGVVPFVEDRPRDPLRIRRLRSLGFIGHAGVFDMTEEPSLLIRKGEEGRIVAALTEALRPGFRQGRWDVVNLRAHGIALDAVLADLGTLATGKADVRGGSDYVELPECWQSYRKSLTRSMRDNLPYYPRLLTRDGHDWSVRVLTEPEEMMGAAMRLATLHQARASSDKGRRHDSHLHGPVQEAFLAMILRRLAADGKARVGELIVDGAVVASQAFLECGDTMMVYYSGFDEAWYRYSPIFVIDAVTFRDALERGIRRLDFLRSPAPWKSRWLARPGLPMHRVVLVSRRLASRLRYALYWSDEAIQRNVVRKIARLDHKLLRLRTALERTLIPLVPVASRMIVRLAPAAHSASVQAAFHHR